MREGAGAFPARDEGVSHVRAYLDEACRIAEQIDAEKVEELAVELAALRERGDRLFVLGLGGSAANASHAVNDLRRLCGIESYAPTDNVAELTAAMNDDGPTHVFDSAFRWMRGGDAVMILSVGGGAIQVSGALTIIARSCAVGDYPLYGIVGRDGGETAKHAKVCVIVPPLYPDRVTPHTEAFQSVILHALVSHPLLLRNKTNW